MEEDMINALNHIRDIIYELQSKNIRIRIRKVQRYIEEPKDTEIMLSYGNIREETEDIAMVLKGID